MILELLVTCTSHYLLNSAQTHLYTVSEYFRWNHGDLKSI